MSFDLPANVEREVQQYAQSQHISTPETVVKLIQDSLRAKLLEAQREDLVTDEMIRQLKELDGSFGLFEEISEEQLDRMEETIRRMNQEPWPDFA